jgi:hypothetical protein
MGKKTTSNSIDQNSSAMEVRCVKNDPLDRAWMAKHLGMRFIRPDGSEVNLSHSSYEPRGGDRMLRFIAVPEASDSIHPDSLHLLEQISDEQKKAMKLLGLWPESESNGE